VQRECEDEVLKQLVLAPLPTHLVRLVFLLLPADARLRCREVCRGWCAFLADASLWRVCDLSVRSGVVARRTPSLLHAACVRAQGTLQVLDVTGWRGLFDDLLADDLLAEEGESSRLTVLMPVLHSNAGSLVKLLAWDCFDTDGYYLSTTDIEDLCVALPRLRLLACDAVLVTLRLFEEPQFAPVRLRTLCLHPRRGVPLDVPAVVATLSQHASLSRLHLWAVALDTEPALDAVVNLAISQLQHLNLGSCRLSPASLPALTRILGSRCRLAGLDVWNVHAPLIVGASVPAFCAALRASRLVELELRGMSLWVSLEAGLAVIAACTDHPTLCTLNFLGNDLDAAPGRAAIEAALDALEASNTKLHLTRN